MTSTLAQPPAFRTRRLGVNEALGMENRKIVLQCPWLDCTNESLVYRSQVLTDLNRGRAKATQRALFCAEHRELVRRVTGSPRMNGFGRVFATPDRVYSTRTAQPQALRVVVFVQFKERCGNCRLPLVFSEQGKTWWMDHTIPVYRGGLTTLRNLTPLCTKCHKSKTRIEIQETRQSRPNTSRREWLTHAQKDQMIASLQVQVADLTRQIEAQAHA